MHVAYLLLSLGLVHLVSGSVVSKLPRSYTVPINVNPNVKRNGQLEYAKALRRFSNRALANTPKVLVNSGSVTLTLDSGEYLVPVNIDGQTFNLALDTSSPYLWVFSTSLPKAEQTGHTIFNPAKSTHWKATSGCTWTLTYGSGDTASGTCGVDTVSVGKTTVTNQTVYIASSVSSGFVSDTASNGFFGLGLAAPNTSPPPPATFFRNAISGLTLPVFTLDLGYPASGSIEFGAITPSKYTGSIVYAPVNSANGFWEFTGSGYAIGAGVFKSLSIDAIVDSGTTLIYLPAAVVKAYYNSVTGAVNDNSQGGYVFPCSSALPNLSLGIGSYHAVIPGTSINYAPVNSTTCFGGVQSNAGIGFSIYGVIFLQSQFVVFDSTPRLGFAAKAT